MMRKFYAAHSVYGKCSIDSLNYTAWDKIKAFGNKKSRESFVGENDNWFSISAAEYNQMYKIKEKHNMLDVALLDAE